jgi:transcriptional regulator with XRE-family HTH domain
MNSDAFKHRLEVVIGDKSNRSFADMCGLSEGTLRRYLRGETYPPLDTLELISIAGDVSLAWLATGEGEMRRGETGAGQTQTQTQSAVNTGGSVNQVATGHHDGDVYIYNSSPEPHAAKPEIAELVILLDRYANKALLEELKSKLLNIKKVMEG